MNTVVITIAEGTTVKNFKDALVTGDVKMYRLRGNDTTRHIPYLAPGTPERETAEWVMEQREEGVTMKEIAKAMHLSVPAVRRIINGMLLAEEMEAMTQREIRDLLRDAKA